MGAARAERVPEFNVQLESKVAATRHKTPAGEQEQTFFQESPKVDKNDQRMQRDDWPNGDQNPNQKQGKEVNTKAREGWKEWWLERAQR